MDSDSIRSIINFGVGGGVTLAGVITFLLLFYAYKRTGSPHVILARFWAILHGDKECKNPIIKNFLDDQSALHQFVFMTGIRAKTTGEIAVLQTWVNSNGETIPSVSECGPYFDIRTCTPRAKEKLPSQPVMLTLALGVVVLALMTTTSLMGVAYNRAVLKMKDTGTWFSMNSEIAKAIGPHPGFSLENCPSVIANRDHPGFEQSDVAHICKWRQDKGSQRFIAATVSEQRLLFSAAAVLLSFLLVKLYKTVVQMSAVLALWSRLRERTRIAETDA